MHTMLTEIVLSTDVVRGAEAREHEKIAYQASARSEDCPLCRGLGTNVSVTGSQLLHLSARTRCRWSLRFQVSYLTLLLRRTNRSGPVDFLPRIFAEVTAHRHQVMPRGD